MRVFISWSGGRSHRLARVMKEWLEECFSGHGISAFVSSEIPKGYLLGLEQGALRGPLSAYQATVATMEDTLRRPEAAGAADRAAAGRTR